MKVNFHSARERSSITEQGRPVEDAFSSSYSEWDVHKTWSSQEVKPDEWMEVGTRRLVVTAKHTDRFTVDNDKINSYTEAESQMSSESRSFLHRVNESSAKEAVPILKRCNERQRQTLSYVRRMIMSSTIQASVFMVKSFQTNGIPSKIQKISQ